MWTYAIREYRAYRGSRVVGTVLNTTKNTSAAGCEVWETPVVLQCAYHYGLLDLNLPHYDPDKGRLRDL